MIPRDCSCRDDNFAEVALSAGSASVVTTGVAFREECVDSVWIPSDSDDFAEVASLAGHGWVAG